MLGVSQPTDSFTDHPARDIHLLDPACGSGHMLTYAFDLLVKIYEEEGHAPSEIPGLILRHNLYGLEICPRAAQLAQFALVCKAREYARAAFRNPVQPQVMYLQDVVFDDDELQNFSSHCPLSTVHCPLKTTPPVPREYLDLWLADSAGSDG